MEPIEEPAEVARMEIAKRVIEERTTPLGVRHVPVLYKRARDEYDVPHLRRHHQCLERLGGMGIAPTSYLAPGVTYGYQDDGESDEFLWPEEDLGTSQAITIENEVEFARGCVRLLDALHQKGIHHADLTRHNIIVKDNQPYALDFHESIFYGEDTTPKRPEGDAYWMWTAASELSPDSTRRIRRWRAIRPYLVPNTSFVDYGTSMGDFLAMAEVEFIGLNAFGYDNCMQEDWTGRLQHGKVFYGDITTLVNYECHTALFMSVYPHIANAMDEAVAFTTLQEIIAGSKQAFVEVQLLGDGIGNVTAFQDDDDLLNNLLLPATRGMHKRIDPIVTIPVHGRDPYTRTVWRIYDG